MAGWRMSNYRIWHIQRKKRECTQFVGHISWETKQKRCNLYTGIKKWWSVYNLGFCASSVHECYVNNNVWLSKSRARGTWVWRARLAFTPGCIYPSPSTYHWFLTISDGKLALKAKSTQKYSRLEENWKTICLYISCSVKWNYNIHL